MSKKRIAQILFSGALTLCAAAIVGLLDLAEKVEEKRKAAKQPVPEAEDA